MHIAVPNSVQIRLCSHPKVSLYAINILHKYTEYGQSLSFFNVVSTHFCSMLQHTLYIAVHKRVIDHASRHTFFKGQDNVFLSLYIKGFSHPAYTSTVHYKCGVNKTQMYQTVSRLELQTLYKSNRYSVQNN